MLEVLASRTATLLLIIYHATVPLVIKIEVGRSRSRRMIFEILDKQIDCYGNINISARYHTNVSVTSRSILDYRYICECH